MRKMDIQRPDEVTPMGGQRARAALRTNREHSLQKTSLQTMSKESSDHNLATQFNDAPKWKVQSPQ
ncbi:hypothetical protein M513_04852 [Trichuris suis]|uniref:Uncharacterized protein n=1 Tax=Trichuris suis TaxID=68888 RepID=A0A085MAR4_9BILA|nr:hypothetical protein M513_04852 [Trichuris suis]